MREGPRDECGVFGIVAPGHEVSRLTYFALYALQHRGQESAGIATSQGGHIMAMRDQGLVNQVFDEQKLRALQGDMAVGHVRYSTTGANSWENSQPVWRADKLEDALADVIGRLEGAYSTVVMTKDRVVAFRDPLGLRPLTLGMIGDTYCVASESCAFDIIGAKFLRDVQPGEVVSITTKGLETRQAVPSPRSALCVFEHIYFARPDSRLGRAHV